MNLAQDLILAQRADLSTHILINTPNNTKAICGTDVGTFLSWYETVTYYKGRYMNPHGFCEKDPKHYVDCRRCHTLFEKNRPSQSK